MRIITIDFETYWNSKEKYSLAKMGPIEYIRDSRFYVQCMGFRIDHGQTFVVPAGHIRKTINALRLDEPGTVVVGHNINGFDALVLSEHYGVRPYMIIDTISMMNWLGLSRVMSCSHKTLTAALGHGVKQAGTVASDGKKHISDFAPEDWKFFMRYCADDVIQCSENFFTMLPMVTNSDALRLMSITAKMATEPVFVPDEAMLDEYVKKLDADTEAKRNELSHIFNFENSEAMLKAIRSRSQFPKLLESLGCPCPMKWSEKQQKNIPAISKTDLEFTALLEHSDERVVALVRARLEQNSSIQKSRANNLLTFSGKPIPIMLGVYKAHTGRYTAGNEGTSDGLNFQNLSKRDPSKLAIRESIKAPAGYKVVACDSSQIEARILAWVAGQEDLVEQFRDGRDPYAEMASKIFGQTAQEIHDGAKRGDHPQHDLLKRERNVGKTCILSCLGADTEVLTDTGWKPIIKVSLTDKLWDGEQWVNHTGLSYNGMKKTIELDGLRLTADHLIWNGTTWNVAKDYLKEPSYIVSAVKYATESLETLGLSNTTDQKQLNFCSNVSNAKMNCGLKNTIFTDLIPNIVNTVTRMWQQVLDLSNPFIQTHSQVISSESLLLSDVNADHVLLDYRRTAQNVTHWCSATAEQSHIGCCSLTCAQENLQDVMHVLRKSPQTHTQKSTQDMQTSVLTQNYVDDCLIGSQVSCNDAIHQHAEYIQAMGVEVSNVCSVQDESFWNIYSRWMGMIIRNYLLIESIMMETMKEVICGLPQLMNSLKTDALYSNYKHVFDCLKQSLTNTRVEPVYDLLNAGPNHRFTVRTKHGAMIVHNCGYGVSAQKFSDTLLRSNVQLDDNLEQHAAMAAHAHAVYRQASSGITSFWKQCDRIIRLLASTDKIGQLGTFGAHNEFIAGRAFIPGTQTNCAYLQLPNGYRLWYPNLRMYETQVIYDRIVHGKPTVTRIYGAGAVENCIAKGTKVLTDSGWKPIETVLNSDLVWDGTEFVKHKGVKAKGIQKVINVNGVYMTDDHLVLENGEWNYAKTTKRPDMADIGRAHSYTSPSFRWKKILLVIPMQLWKLCCTLWIKRDKGSETLSTCSLSYLSNEASESHTGHSQNVEDKNIWCVAQHGTKMYRTYSSGLEKLWWSWNNSVRRMAQVRELLCRYGEYISRWLMPGQNRQYEGILQGELSLGYLSGKCQQHAFFQPNTNNGEMQRTWNKPYDCLQQDEKWMARGYAVYKTGQKQCQATSTGQTDLQQEVFDIIECGPRHRFVVQGNYPMTVHNCCQSYAFMMLGWQACRMQERGIDLKANIHDAWITVVPEDKAEETKRIMEECMSAVPDWLAGFPVGCEAEIGDDFRIA